MNEIIRDIYVLKKEIQEPLEMTQGTDGIPVIFRFVDYSIPEGTEARVFVRKPSGKEQQDSGEVIKNDIKISITSQMTAEVGYSDLQVQLKNGDKDIYTFIYRLDVKRSLMKIDSNSGSTIIDKYLNKIHEATDNANTATQEANRATEAANTATQAANTAAEEANTAAGEADTATQEANRATEAANTATQAANTAAEEANTAAENIENKAKAGDFSATIKIGAVTTGAPGTEAQVTNSGNSKDAVFDFTIPRGDTGEVKNIDTVTVKFEEANIRENINSGEGFATLFGKIKKYFSDLTKVAFTGSYNDLGDKPEIQNNLTTEIPGGVLDATQGKNLDEKKVDKDKIVKSTEISEEGFIMDGKTCSEALDQLNANSIEKSITGTTSDYGNLDTGISHIDYFIVSAKLNGCVCIPYIGSNGKTWSINIRSSGNFSAYSNKKVTVETFLMKNAGMRIK